MDTTDYYTILGVDQQASTEVIRAAFKKLALQYHPDVYKGDDAQELMRGLLQAYQTLSDPVARQEYDARRGGKAPASKNEPAFRSERETSQRANGDKRFVFPDLSTTVVAPLAFSLENIAYHLSAQQAETLYWEGVLRGTAREPAVSSSGVLYSCHRCHHPWSVPASISGSASGPSTCPRCQARDWSDYLLLRCTHCQAVFESREIADPLRGGSLYHPYELFPLCPNCRRSQWCPAENKRVTGLQASAARRSMMIWGGVIGVCAVLVVFLALALLR